MIRDGSNILPAWRFLALGIALANLAAGLSSAETVREMESARGWIRIAIVPLESPATSASGDLPPAAPADEAATDAGKDSVHPVEAIADFTSLSEMAREGEALLQITYFDKAAREELRFPLRYSELRRYLRKHPLEYREGSLADRNVDLVGDLAGALRIKMAAPGGSREKP